MRNVKIILSFLYLLSFAQASWGQTAYKGGEGDGHAMAGLELGTINSVGEHISIDVYPTIIKSGDFIHLPGEINVKEIYLVSVNGIINQLIHTGSDVKNVRVESTSPGVYLLQIHSNDGRKYFSKFLILND